MNWTAVAILLAGAMIAGALLHGPVIERIPGASYIKIDGITGEAIHCYSFPERGIVCGD